MDSRTATSEKTARIRVVMDRSFSRFGEADLTALVDDLGFLAGCESDEIDVLSVRRGCVKVEARFSEAAIEKILTLFGRLDRSDIADDSELEAMRQFVVRHNVSNMSGEFEVRLQIVAKGTRSDRHVVFVHGWRGGEGTFGNLPSLLSEALSCESSIYEYPSGFWKKSPSLIYVSRNLDNWVRNHAGGKQLAFIAHSYGGLVVRKTMVLQRSYPDPLDQRTNQITFMASPHHGAVLASLADVVPTIRKEQLHELSPDSAVLFELNSDWQEWVSRMVPKPCGIRSLVGIKDAVVSTASAQGLDPRAIPILERTHTDIVDIQSADDEVFVTIKRLLKESTFLQTISAPASAEGEEKAVKDAEKAARETGVKVAE